MLKSHQGVRSRGQGLRQPLADVTNLRPQPKLQAPAEKVTSTAIQGTNVQIQTALPVISTDEHKAPEEAAIAPSTTLPMSTKTKTTMLELWKRKCEKEVVSETYKEHILKTLLTEEAEWGKTWLMYEPGEERDNFLLAHQAVVDKMADFSVRYKIQTKTLESAILLFDKIYTSPQMARYVKQPGRQNTEGRYSIHAIAMTLLFMEAKFEEVYPPPLSTFLKWCGKDVNAADFVMLEHLLLLELGWNLLTVTATDYLGWFFAAVKGDSKTKHLTYFILECSYRMKPLQSTANRKWDLFGKKKQAKAFQTSELLESYPSKLALGCVCLSLAYQGRICFPKPLADLVGLASYEVGPLIYELHMQIRSVVQKNQTRPNATVKKFALRRHMQIGHFKPPAWDEMVAHNAFRQTQIAETVRKLDQYSDLRVK